ncbi:MAG: hypothetical protein V1806_17645 [Pseudomonadota bacterium]
MAGLAGRAGRRPLAAGAAGWLLALLALLAGLAWSAPATAAAPSAPQDPAYLGFFPPPETSGQMPVELFADPRTTSRVTDISFGVPFPPGCLSDPKLIALIDNTGKELPIHVKVLATWPPPVPHAGSIRVALVQFRDLIATSLPRTYTLRWGAPRKENEPDSWPARQQWLPVEDKDFMGTMTMEPPVYAVLPHKWLGKSLIRGRILPEGADLKWEFYDHNMKNYFLTSINKIDPRVEKKFFSEFTKDLECWLFDRSSAFFVTYIRQGGLEPLRQGVRAAEFYGAHVQPNGKFSLLAPSAPVDVKYGYQECLAINYWLTGDERMLKDSQYVLKLLDAWDPVLTPSRTFWTERHLAFAMLNATVAYELTGDPKLLERARFLFEAGYNAQVNPPPGAPKDGCMIHTAKQGAEESNNGPGWICSSWMSALAVDAMLRYYIVSADPRVPQSVEMLANSIVRHGMYVWPKWKQYGEKYPVSNAYYLYSSQPPTQREAGEYTDMQHSLDVLKTIMAAQYFLRKQGRSDPGLNRVQEELLHSTKRFLEIAHVKNGPAAGSPEYPVWPKRRFNWLFRTTADLDWFSNQK